VQPPPDTKDWTWTLTRRCDQCGLSAGDIGPEDFAQRAFVAAEEWVQILRSSPAVTARPRPDVWSPLEYGAHVRDVYRLFDARLVQMLMRIDKAGSDQFAVELDHPLLRGLLSGLAQTGDASVAADVDIHVLRSGRSRLQHAASTQNERRLHVSSR